MTEQEKKRMNNIIKHSKVIDGVNIVTMPLIAPCVVCAEGSDKYIFVSSKLPQKHREELIKSGLKKHREGFEGEKLLHSEVRYMVAKIVSSNYKR